MEWKSIDSCPKDENLYMGFGEDKQIFLFYWGYGDWYEYHVYGEIAYEINPIYWMPLPEAPKE